MPEASLRRDQWSFCSYESYRKAVKQQNISFTRLSGEECSKCSLYVTHLQEYHSRIAQTYLSHRSMSSGFSTCAGHAEPMRRVREAREQHRADADRDWSAEELIISADMMKVTVLPVMPFKEAIFTSRLICYETFSTIMPTERSKKGRQEVATKKSTSACVLWHEALAGRSAGEVDAACVLYL